MNKILVYIALIFLCIGGISLTAQVKPNEPELLIQNLNHEVFNGCLNIDFELPDQGVVEFALLSGKGTKIWFNQYLSDSGENKIKVNLKPLTEGETYEFKMVFKGNKYGGEFEADHTVQEVEEEYEEYEDYDDEYDDEYDDGDYDDTYDDEYDDTYDDTYDEDDRMTLSSPERQTIRPYSEYFEGAPLQRSLNC